MLEHFKAKLLFYALLLLSVPHIQLAVIIITSVPCLQQWQLLVCLCNCAVVGWGGHQNHVEVIFIKTCFHLPGPLILLYNCWKGGEEGAGTFPSPFLPRWRKPGGEQPVPVGFVSVS